MAKKIRIDFSKTEDRSKFNTRNMPEGLYLAKVKEVYEKEAQDGTAMLVYAVQPLDREYRSRIFPIYCKLQANQLWKLRDLLIAGGVPVPKKAINIDPEAIVGSTICIEVVDDIYQGNIRSSVGNIFEKSLAQDSSDEDPEDHLEEDEEFEMPEGEEEEEFEISEEDLDEDDWDDEEEDDWEEESDEDDWEDEEEEEPKPAPKPASRKPAKRPVKVRRNR